MPKWPFRCPPVLAELAQIRGGGECILSFSGSAQNHSRSSNRCPAAGYQGVADFADVRPLQLSREAGLTTDEALEVLATVRPAKEGGWDHVSF